MTTETTANPGSGAKPGKGTSSGCPRDYLTNGFVYVVMSPRARGLSVGVNLNPDQACNFDCLYCEIDRSRASGSIRPELDVESMARELEATLNVVRSGKIREIPNFSTLPENLLQLRHVAISGDGEPTLSPKFAEAVDAVISLRARGQFPFFPIVLITNASGLSRPEVGDALRLFTARDEIWLKLEAGSDEYMQRVNKPDCSIESIQTNILNLSRQRPVVIQSLFPSINGEGPSAQEIEAYAQRLRWIKAAGGQISLVQIYSATRPAARSICGHLPLRTLSQIAQKVREVAGVNAEVF